MSNFRFESAHSLLLLWLVPLIFFLAMYLNKAVREALGKALGQKLTPFLTATLSAGRRSFKLWLEIAAITFFIVAYARPQVGEGHQSVKNEGIEIMFLFDVSNSMLAEDVKPSRLEFAKSEISRFVDTAAGDRMGLVAFAGSAALMSPMTTDQDAIKMYIESLNTDSVSTQGTNFSKALSTAEEAFARGGLGDQVGAQVTRAIVIISDGEDNEPGANEEAEALAKEGIRIFTIAIGTEEGAAIPIRDEQGQVRGYKRDKSGTAIVTKTTGAPLKELARIGQGSFYHASYQTDAVKAIYDDIGKLQKTEFETGEVRSYNEYFQPLLVLGLALAIIEILLGERRPKARLWKGRFEVTDE